MIHLRAPAKLNLYLRVIGKRPDGYHELETVFERIDLADELTFEPAAHDLRLTCSDPALSVGEDNLVLQAARLLRQASGTTCGARIHLTKRVPIAAGLGGGSSDAAATLRGLDELWALRLSRAKLARLAARIGSDVPFFLEDAPMAVGRGRGERCEPLFVERSLAHVLVCPEARLSTKDVYAGSRFDPSTSLRIESRARVEGFDLTAPTPSLTMVLHALRNGSLGELATGLWNDLEPEAIRRCPVIAQIQSRLRAVGCLGARISGSGPSVFGLCQNTAQAQDVAARIRRLNPPSWRIEIIHTDHPSLVGRPSTSY